ncbi:MAG: neutral/alkaline non-lysosomal ceramidase N-terminal domain-containing protein [Lentisphaerae bacterium]|nr:neutral/alkaline non-lysosomal ceramidase N-terminal domain-containing protein [Lentisphaerota bacterium]
MKIGFSKIDITPPMGVTMCGQIEALKAEGVESPLHATCMCIEDNGRKTAFLSCDILVITNEFATEISEASPVQLIIGATHTHSGPATVNLFGGNANGKYLEDLKNNVLKAITDASESIVGANLFYSKDILEGFAFNRRFLMSDGTVETHPLKGNPHTVRKEGPDSKDLHVLWAKTEAGKIIGGMVVFGCHATVMERSNKLISSDFPGKATGYLEKMTGAPFLYFQSACGNICQVNPLDTSNHEVGRDWSIKMGGAIGGKALEKLSAKGLQLKSCGEIKAETIRLPRRKLPAELLEWANNHRKINSDTPGLSDYGVEKYNRLPPDKISLEAVFKTDFWANFYAGEIKTRDLDYHREADMPLNIRVVALGENLAIVALPCELFIEWQNRIIEASPFKNTIVIELANGWNGYVPTQEAFARQGGYETKEVTSTMLVPEAGQIMYEAVIRMLKVLAR